jgi:hypothetical protein
VGTCAIVVLAVDPNTKKRMVLDVVAKRGLRTLDNLKGLLVKTATTWRPVEIKVENDAFQGGTFRDQELADRLRNLGCRLTEEHTNKYNKFDIEAGVLSSGFDVRPGRCRHSLHRSTKEWADALIAELASWRAELGRRQTQDRVMAFWLADLAARNYEKTWKGTIPRLKVPEFVKGRRYR